MKKGLIRGLAAACTLTMVFPLLAGCGKNDSSTGQGSSAGITPAATAAAKKEPAKISVLSPDGGRVLKEDHPVLKEIEKKLNIKLEITLVSGDYGKQYSVLVASGSLPDISRTNGFEYLNFVDQGLYYDITPHLQKDAPNLNKWIKKETWEAVKYKGKLYGVPMQNNAGKMQQVIRKDWLDNLGLKMPSTVEEFEDVLKKFTQNDPDKNGKNDTYGLGGYSNLYYENFSMIFGAFGTMPRQFYMKDNKIYAQDISPQYKAAVEFIAKLFSQKLVDPDIFVSKTEQNQQKLVQSKYGTFAAWYTIAPVFLMTQLKMSQVNPNAKWDPVFPAVKGKDGKNGMESKGTVSAFTHVSSKCKEPEAAVKFLDYLISEEGWETANYGLKGVHHNDDMSFTDEGKKAYAEKWLDPLGQIFKNLDMDNKLDFSSKDPATIEKMRFMKPSMENNLYQSFFYGIATPDFKTLNPDLEKYQEEWFIKFVTGSEPMSKWDEYVKGWNAKGGKKILESMTSEYNKNKGTNYTVGE